MPTVDEEGPRRFDPAVAQRAKIAFLRGHAVEAHADWQAAVVQATEAHRAAKAAMNTADFDFRFDQARAAHRTAQIAESLFTRTRDLWFAEDRAARAAFQRRFKFDEAVRFSEQDA